MSRRFASVLLLVLLIGCERAEDISAKPAGRPIMRVRCIRLLAPVFVVERSERLSKMDERTRIRVAPPESLFAPMSIEDYRSGKVQKSDGARVVAILESRTELTPVEVWSLASFEISMLSVMARVEQGELAGRIVDATDLLSTPWKVYLGDGQLHAVEARELRGVPLLIPEYAKECEPEGQGAQ
jgi:hypothetical protein